MRVLPSAAAVLAVLIVALLAASAPARAQATTRSQENVLETLDADQPIAGKYSLDIGLGTIMTARVDARASKIYPIVPYVSFRYDDLLALDENEARVNFIRPDGGLGSPGWRAGPMLKVDTGRPRFGSSGLQSLPAIDRTLEVGGFVSYTVGPARLRLNARGDVTGGHGGAIVEFVARSGFFQSGRLSLAAQAEIDWVSRPYMQTFHGVTPIEAAQTGLRAFAPGSGFNNADASVMGQFQIDKHWSIIGVLQYSRLLGEAASSPITARRRGVNRANLGSFVVYTF
jgi:outer membrane scaffolding protein for murein synthesis (MipA/OmpV family)